MQHSRIKIFCSVALAFVTGATTGCGNDESSAKRQATPARSGDKWFDAGGVELTL